MVAFRQMRAQHDFRDCLRDAKERADVRSGRGFVRAIVYGAISEETERIIEPEWLRGSARWMWLSDGGV